MDAKINWKQQYPGLTKKQIQIIEYLQDHRQNITHHKIGDGTGIKYCTIRNCIHAMMKYKIIQVTNIRNIGNTKIMDIEFLDEAFLSKNPTDEQKENCIKKKSKEIMENHPELGYWRENGLNVNHLHEWHREFGTKYEALQLSLRWCAFDMVHNNHEKEKDIKSPINWIYSILKYRGGEYPKPPNYLSFEDREEKMLEERIAEKLAQNERMKKLRIISQNAEHVEKFEEMMADPDGELYKRCFERVNSYLRQRNIRKKNTLLFTNGMKKAYGEIYDLENFDTMDAIKDLEKFKKEHKK